MRHVVWGMICCSMLNNVVNCYRHYYILSGLADIIFSYKFHCLKSGTEQENENRMHDSGECVATRMADQSAFESFAMFIAYARNCLCLHFVTASRFSDVAEYGKKLVYIVACVWTNNCVVWSLVHCCRSTCQWRKLRQFVGDPWLRPKVQHTQTHMQHERSQKPEFRFNFGHRPVRY